MANHSDRLRDGNIIINGDMRISQRGTSFVNQFASSAYLLDRMRILAGSSTGRATVIQEFSDVPAGYSNSMKIDVTTIESIGSNPGALGAVQYRIEDRDVQHFKYGDSGALGTVLSYWIKSNKLGTLGAYAFLPDTNRIFRWNTIIANMGWNQYYVYIPGDPSGAISLNGDQGFEFIFVLFAGSSFQVGSENLNVWEAFTTGLIDSSAENNWFDSTTVEMFFTGFQFEIGQVPRPFYFRPYETELSLCQRYFEMSYPQFFPPGTVTFPGAQLRQSRGLSYWEGDNYKVTKRTTPTITLYSPVTGAPGTVDNNGQKSATAQDIGDSGFRFLTVTSPFNGDCNYHWTAESEL